MPVNPEVDTAEYPALPLPPGDEPPPPFSSLVQVEVAALSHPGKVRPNNEDHFLVGRTGRYLEVLTTNLPEGEVAARSEETGYGLVVADGMGGVEGGEVASRLAIRTLVNLVLHVPDWILRLDDDERVDETMQRASRRYRQIDAALSRYAAADPKLSRMGTTMTLAYSLGADLFIVHVGDSRAYLCRAGQLRQLTRDQTLAQAMVDMGVLTRKEAASSRLRHVLTCVLGQNGGDVQVEVQRLALADGDCLLLCTDGLTEMVADAQIAEVLGRSGTADETCRTLTDLALEHGGRDNVTVLVARYRFPRSAQRSASQELTGFA
jgi:serine/threonine protein phosphatase PrpC